MQGHGRCKFYSVSSRCSLSPVCTNQNSRKGLNLSACALHSHHLLFVSMQINFSIVNRMCPRLSTLSFCCLHLDSVRIFCLLYCQPFVYEPTAHTVLHHTPITILHSDKYTQKQTYRAPFLAALLAIFEAVLDNMAELNGDDRI
jgi:hypothetical protein